MTTGKIKWKGNGGEKGGINAGGVQGEENKSEVVVLQRRISPIVARAEQLVIKDAVGMREAGELLSQLNLFNDQVVAEREKVTKPLNEALKAERGRWKPIEVANEEAIGLVRGKMSEYQTMEMKRVREEEARIAARVGEGKGKFKVETAVRKMEEIESVEEKVVSDSGMVKFREDKVLVIEEVMKIPREYLVVDERAVLAALKAGKIVLGARLEIKMVPVNFR